MPIPTKARKLKKGNIFKRFHGPGVCRMIGIDDKGYVVATGLKNSSKIWISQDSDVLLLT